MNLNKSLLYNILQNEREQILRHKWLESEKVGYDIGYSQAILSWNWKHRQNWMLHELSQIRATFSGDMSQNVCET